MSVTKKRAETSDEERQMRREADRQRAREAIEALRSSVGWQRWLGSRRYFHRYCLIISGGRCR